ncbi:acetyl-CoA carboxylase biotin carboxylase subunit [Salinifilum ghardaiensis]
MFSTVLVANRGEIALRVVRACKELGIRVAVAHSTADRETAAVRNADAAVCIGPGPTKLSYLNIPAMIEAARVVGADAIHPGYGFLSENPDFSEVCAAENITFVGPSAPIMATLGDKAACRSLMAEAGLPLLPGSLEPVASPQEAQAVAAEAGWPVVLKAVAGGGGRGIRVVERPADLIAAYEQTRQTALSLFGDSRVYIERYLSAPRHVEVQILADHHGTVVALGERDCSVQRRHQKLVEEAPAPGLCQELTEELVQHAVRGAKAAGYVGAGTFEFLVDDQQRGHFMEVNCRIQVEHPVTEMVTGIDIIAEQLSVASGNPLSDSALTARPNGCAIECRINAEDPARDFTPAPGRLESVAMPAGPFVRVDTHVDAGAQIPPFYDSMLAKVLAWGPNRRTAISRMRRALTEVDVEGRGVETTTQFLNTVMAHPEFAEARHDIGTADRVMQSWESD